MKLPQTVTELWSVQDYVEKFNQRGITRKHKGGAIILMRARRPDLIHIPGKLHEDIPNDY